MQNIPPKKHSIVAFMRFLWQRFLDNQIPQVAGSLTHTTLLALVPLLTVMLVVITAFPMFGDVSAAFMNAVEHLIVPTGASAVADYLNDFKNHAGKLTSIGIVMMILTSLLLVRTIDDTFNRIWQVRHQRPLRIRLPVYWLLLTLGPLATGFSVSLSAYFMRLDMLDRLPHFASTINIFGQIALNTLLFFGIFRIVPNRTVALKHALFGGFITALFLQLAKSGFGLYVRNFNSYELIYGAFAAIPVFLIWLQIVWMIILSGAVFTSSLAYWRGCAYLHTDRQTTHFDDIVALLLLLAQAQQNRQTLNTQDFRQHLSIGCATLDDILDHLVQHDYIEQGERGWLLKTTPERITLSALFTQFVYNPDAPDTGNVRPMQGCLKIPHHTLADILHRADTQTFLKTPSSSGSVKP